jgi:hypothetical protein
MSSIIKFKKNTPFKAAASKSGHPVTSPSDSPTLPAGILEFANQVIEAVKLIQVLSSTSESKEASPSVGPQIEEDAKSTEVRTRASRLEFKTVDEIYVS